MNHKHRLRVSRTTVRTLDAAELAVFGGTLDISAIAHCPTRDRPTECNGSAGDDGTRFLTGEIPH